MLTEGEAVGYIFFNRWVLFLPVRLVSSYPHIEGFPKKKAVFGKCLFRFSVHEKLSRGYASLVRPFFPPSVSIWSSLVSICSMRIAYSTQSIMAKNLVCSCIFLCCCHGLRSLWPGSRLHLYYTVSSVAKVARGSSPVLFLIVSLTSSMSLNCVVLHGEHLDDQIVLLSV